MHLYLLRTFRGRVGASYVNKRDYGLGDSEHQLIKRGEWSDVVKAGSRLYMTLVIRDQAPRCPYCQVITNGSEASLGDGRIIWYVPLDGAGFVCLWMCSEIAHDSSACRRPYVALQGTQSDGEDHAHHNM